MQKSVDQLMKFNLILMSKGLSEYYVWLISLYLKHFCYVMIVSFRLLYKITISKFKKKKCNKLPEGVKS